MLSNVLDVALRVVGVIPKDAQIDYLPGSFIRRFSKRYNSQLTITRQERWQP